MIKGRNLFQGRQTFGTAHVHEQFGVRVREEESHSLTTSFRFTAIGIHKSTTHISGLLCFFQILL